MKRIILLILCMILILPSVYVCAEGQHTLYNVNVDAGDGVESLKAVVNDGEIYIRTKDFSKITRYNFDEATSSFLIDGQAFEKAFKWVRIDKKNKKIQVKTHNIDLDNYYEVDDELYLPFSQMLPILNASIYEIKNSVIYIANNRISLAEILYEFDIQDYWFNMSDEFANKDFLAVAFVIPSYLFDTVVNFRYNRLDIFTHSGEYSDYKDIFSGFLVDDNLYLEAMAKEPNALDEASDFFTSVNSTSKKLNSIYGWVEQAGKSEIDSNTGGKLLDALKESYDSKELEYDNLKGLNDAWTSGAVSFADVFESLNYAYTYITQVEDNRKMLNSVYNVNKKMHNKEVDRRAAKQVYDLYGEKVVTAITKEIAGSFTEDAIKDLVSPIAIYEATAKVAGIAINAVVPYDADDIAKMPLYANIISSASSKYLSYSTETDEETTNLRLSLLLSMISSKKCFEIMKDAFDGAGKNGSYYQSKIKKIDKLIMALYMAEENTEFDSYEHFEEYSSKYKKTIEKSGVLNSLAEYTADEFDINKMLLNSQWISNGVSVGMLEMFEFYEDGTYITGLRGAESNEYIFSYKFENNRLYLYESNGYEDVLEYNEDTDQWISTVREVRTSRDYLDGEGNIKCDTEPKTLTRVLEPDRYVWKTKKQIKPSDIDVSEYIQIYHPIFLAYQTIERYGKSADIVYEYPFVNSEILGRSEVDTFYYVLDDVNSDSVPELVISSFNAEDYVIWDIYGIEDNKFKDIFKEKSSMRRNFKICQDGIIRKTTSESAGYVSHVYYELNGVNVKKCLYLAEIDEEFDGYVDYYIKGENGGERITKQEYTDLVNQHNTRNDFEWKKISDYTMSELLNFDYNHSNINNKLFNCIGKSKAEVSDELGPIVESEYYLGGKIYVHDSFDGYVFYKDIGFMADVIDDVPETSKCIGVGCPIKNIIDSMETDSCSIDMLSEMFGNYTLVSENTVADDSYKYIYEFSYGACNIIVKSNELDPEVKYIFIYDKSYCQYKGEIPKF